MADSTAEGEPLWSNLVGASLSLALIAAMPACAEAADNWPLSSHHFFVSGAEEQYISPSLPFVHDGPHATEAPTYAAGMRFELRYRVESSDRFDPANLKFFGGAIGGSGVKGGAVVSLSWPTEH
ncbi:MAG TPA: hypothetical protein VGG69_08340 [Rhizomicrobium sp.]